MIRPRVWIWSSLFLAAACGPQTQIEALSDGASEGEPGTTVDVTPPETMGADGTSGAGTTVTTTAVDGDDGYEDDDGGTGCTFTCPPPLPPATTGGSGGNGGTECDLVRQDCPRGEKCMPWGNDGGAHWNATRCSPLAEVPNAPGDPCQVEGSGFSGIDDCALGTMCWQVDPATNEGTCAAICDALPMGPTCPPSQECVTLDDTVPLCVDGCDPIAQDCPAGQSCTLVDQQFYCGTEPQEPIPLGGACSAPSSSCAGGQLCAYGPGFDCGEANEGCCAEICAVDDPNACQGVGGVCIPWYPVAPPPEYANVGVCDPP